MAEPIRVLVVDDHEPFRQAVRTDLEAYPNIQIVGEAGDGEVGVLSAIKLQPTVIVMDINMSQMDGITATRLIKLQTPHIAVVGLSLDPKDYQIYAMEKAGAFKVLNKNGAVTQLYETLQEAVAAVRPILLMEESSLEKTAINDSGSKAQIADLTDLQFRTT